MQASDAIALFVLFALVIGVPTLVLIFSQNKKFIDSHTPFREQTEEELEAINYLERESDLSFGALNKKAKSAQIYRFTDCSFTLKSRVERFSKSVVIIYYFHIDDNGKRLEIRLPKILFSHLKVGTSFRNVNIETTFRANVSWLFNIEGHLGYLELYKQFHFKDENFTSVNILSKRPITEKEKRIFMFSRWSNVWVVILLVFLPFMAYGLITFEWSIVVTFSIILLPLLYLIFSVAKKRKHYINSREVYKLKGALSYNQDSFTFFIGSEELKLHRKWQSILKNKEDWKGELEIEAIMHTFDNWNEVAKKTFQPILLKSHKQTINESQVNSTRDWMMPLSMLAVLAPIIFMVRVDFLVGDVFYGYRATQLPSQYHSVEELLSSPIKNRQNVSLKALAIPAVQSTTNGETGEKIYVLMDKNLFFPKNKIQDYRKTLGLDQIVQLKRQFEEIQSGKELILRLGGVTTISYFKQDINHFFNLLSTKNKRLDKYASFQTLKKTTKNNLNLVLLNKRFQAFEQDVWKDIDNMIDHALLKLHDYSKEEGITARNDAYQQSERIIKRDIVGFLEKFPREAQIDGAIFIPRDVNDNYYVSKYRMVTKTELVSTSIQLLLWLALLVMVLYLLVLVISRIKGNYFDRPQIKASE